MKTVREIYLRFGKEIEDCPAYIIFPENHMRPLNKDEDMNRNCFYAVCSRDLFDDKKVLSFYCSDML